MNVKQQYRNCVVQDIKSIQISNTNPQKWDKNHVEPKDIKIQPFTRKNEKKVKLQVAKDRITTS